jgi:hypothetical protein
MPMSVVVLLHIEVVVVVISDVSIREENLPIAIQDGAHGLDWPPPTRGGDSWPCTNPNLADGANILANEYSDTFRARLA